jgi:hypothetical protein
MPSLNELVGSVKVSTDLSSEQVRIRYNEATTVIGQNGRKIQLSFPKIPGKCLDLSRIRLDFTIDTSSDSQMDVYSYNALFQRIVVKSSSTVLMDINDYGLLASTLAQTSTTVNTNYNDRLTQGLFMSSAEAKTAAVSNRVSLQFIPGTILNCDALLPLDRVSGMMTLELFIQDPRKVLYSPSNDILSNFSLSDIQLICEYISSPSLTQYYNTQPINFSVQNWTHRFQQTADRKTILRLPSAYNSLSRVMVCIRSQNVVDSLNDCNQPDRQQKCMSYEHLSELQLYVNNKPFFSEPLSDGRLLTELWHESKNAFPQLSTSVYYSNTKGYSQVGGCPFIGLNLNNAPCKFKGIVSGLKTSNMVSDIYMAINWSTSILSTVYLAATCFLDNDARVYQDSSGSLQIDN